MSFWTLILICLLAAVAVIAAATVIFALLGAQRGRQEQWARNAFTASLGVIVIGAVIGGAAWAIHALNNITLTTVSDSAEVYATPSALFDASGAEVVTDAVPAATTAPGTIIRATAAPERVTGVNYGADYDLESCNDYVYLLESASVYTGPGTQYEVIGSVIAGATVKRIGYNNDWSLIDYNENYAFVSNDALIVNE